MPSSSRSPGMGRTRTGGRPLAEVTSIFSDFELVANEVLDQETAPSLAALHERLGHRAVSTLELISDEEFEEGIERLRLAAEQEAEPSPVSEPVNLLVFRAP